jgi:hypothetical protein
MSAFVKRLGCTGQANDSPNEREAVELFLGTTLVEGLRDAAGIVGPRVVAAKLKELCDVDWAAVASATLPAARPKEAPWCYRVAKCGAHAVVQVFDADAGQHQPACAKHAEGFGPLETIPLEGASR